MASKFRNKLNSSYCLARIKDSWRLAKIAQGRIYIAEEDRFIAVGTVDDLEKFRYFTESKEYRCGEKNIHAAGATIEVDGVFYFVITAGYRGDDGKVKYLIAR